MPTGHGAAGLVGNLQAESGVLPQRIEEARRHAAAFEEFCRHSDGLHGRRSYESQHDGAHRSETAGHRALRRWTGGTRRSELFTPTFRGLVLGPRIRFDLGAQVDYLVHELRTSFTGVQAALTSPTVTIDGACDEVVYNFEIPGAILSPARKKLPRTDAGVVAVFQRRRPLARNAERLFTASRTAARWARPVRRGPGPGPEFPNAVCQASSFRPTSFVPFDVRRLMEAAIFRVTPVE